MNLIELKRLICDAFAGVTLSGGVSLRQAEAMDNYGEGSSPAEYARLPLAEVTLDWQKIPVNELENRALLPHLDAFGFRYYIPAFMISLIAADSQGSSRQASTLVYLYPKHGALWDHYMMHYSALSRSQKAAIAAFLTWVRDTPEFDRDRTLADRALRNYWAEYAGKR